jgi:hypothetical protein
MNIIKGYIIGMGVHFCITTIYIMIQGKREIFSDDLEDRLFFNSMFSLIYPYVIAILLIDQLKRLSKE